MICVGRKSKELPPGGVNDPDEDLGQGRETTLTLTDQELNGFLELSLRYRFPGLPKAGLDDLMQLFVFTFAF